MGRTAQHRGNTGEAGGSQTSVLSRRRSGRLCYSLLVVLYVCAFSCCVCSLVLCSVVCLVVCRSNSQWY